MNLKTKMVVGSVVSIFLTVMILLLVFSFKTDALQSSYDKSRQNGLKIAHFAYLDSSQGSLQNQQVTITRNRKLKSAIRRKALSKIENEIQPLLNRLSASHVLSDIFVVDQAHQVLFASDKALIGTKFNSFLLSKSLSEVKTISGLEKSPDGHIAINTMIPINSRGKILGGVILVRYYSELLKDMKNTVSADIGLYDSTTSALLATTDAPLFNKIKQGATLYAEKLAVQDKIYDVAGIELKDEQGQKIAHLVRVFDATDQVKSQQFNFSLGIAIVIAWLVLAIILVMLFARKAFRPLDDMVSVSQKIQQTGDMSLRIQVTSKDEISQAAMAVNHTLDSVSMVVNDANKTLNQVAKGNFSVRMHAKAEGDLKTLEVAVNQSVEALDRTMKAILKVVKGIQTGDFSVRMDPCVEASIREPVDHAMNSISNVIMDVNHVLSGMAKGDFSQNVSAPAQGELQVLANHTNESIEQAEEALDDILQVVSALSKGDLTQSVKGEFSGKFGEVECALNTSLQNLSRLILETRLSVHNLVDDVDQIYQGSQDLNDRTQEQAASLEETTATMSHITQAVNQTSENAQLANRLSEEARSQAAVGAEIMKSTIHSMFDIKEASHQIEDIISLIDSIAFQTNLLALNAAVEAARAGEHGRGFAVVAGEVRNLAGKSSEAASDIKKLIENAVMAVEQGTQRAEKSDKALQEITGGIRKVSDIVAEISEASSKQSVSITQISAAIHEIDTATQQNAALVEEASSASESMKNETTALGELVQKFKV